MDGRTVTINGKRWKLVYAKLSRKDGDCDPPGVPGKTIRIARYLRRYPKARAEAIVHEALHCALPEMSEPFIDTLAADLARILDQEDCLKG